MKTTIYFVEWSVWFTDKSSFNNSGRRFVHSFRAFDNKADAETFEKELNEKENIWASSQYENTFELTLQDVVRLLNEKA